MEGRKVGEGRRGLKWDLGTDLRKVSKKGRTYPGEIIGRCENNGEHKTGPIFPISHLETDSLRECLAFIEEIIS